MGFGSCLLTRPSMERDEASLISSLKILQKKSLNSSSYLNSSKPSFLSSSISVEHIGLSSPERFTDDLFIFTFGSFALWSFLNIRLTDQIFSSQESL